jgi:hypothetical protein
MVDVPVLELIFLKVVCGKILCHYTTSLWPAKYFVFLDICTAINIKKLAC